MSTNAKKLLGRCRAALNDHGELDEGDDSELIGAIDQLLKEVSES